jgi:hypothetical protein
MIWCVFHLRKDFLRLLFLFFFFFLMMINAKYLSVIFLPPPSQYGHTITALYFLGFLSSISIHTVSFLTILLCHLTKFL